MPEAQNENNINTGEGTNTDPLDALKSEFSKQNSGVLNEIQALKQSLLGLNEAIKQKSTPAPSQNNNQDEPDPIIDPKGYREYIKRELSQEVESKLDQRLTIQNQRQAQLAALVQDYPELQNNNSDLTKKAIELFSSLSDVEKNSPTAYKFAVQSAAAELGVLTMSKRKTLEDNDNFTINNSNSSSNRSGSGQSNKGVDKDAKIPDETLQFAQLLGLDTNNPEYIKRLKTAAKRKNWSKFE